MRLPTPQDTYDRTNEQKLRRAIETSVADIERRVSSLLTTQGTLAAGAQAITLVNGTNNNISVGYATYVRISGPSAAFTITGIANPEKGRVLILRNTTGQTMTLANDSASSSTENRISTQTGANIVMRGSGGQTAIFVYDSTQLRWVLAADNGASAIGSAATRAALATIPSTSFAAVFLSESGREGLFIWTSTNVSQFVTRDTQQGVYVAPSSDTSGASGAWVRQYSGAMDIKWFGAVADGTTDNKTAIQTAINLTWYGGGGEVYAGKGIWGHSGAIIVYQTVTMVGEGNGYNALYSSTEFRARGTVYKLLAGSNTTSFITRCQAYGSEVINHPDWTRHQGGFRNLVVWGNKSANFATSATDLNGPGTLGGHGIHIQGCSNVSLTDILVVRCAGNGVHEGSYDYGWGVISSNNQIWFGVQSLGNFGSGFNLSGGDQDFTQLVGGFNGAHGFSLSSGGTSLGQCRAWNNALNGFYCAQNWVTFTGCESYDNERAGYYLDTGDYVTMVGCHASRNGIDSGVSAWLRSGLFNANCKFLAFAGCSFIDDALYLPANQQYGVYNNNAANEIVYGGGLIFDGNVIAAIGGISTAAKRMPCIQTVNTTNQFTASTSYVSSGVSATIYPSTAAASVKITVDAPVGAAAALIASLTLYRGATDLTPAGVNGFREVYIPDTNTITPVTFTFVDAPATTGATTYTLYWKTSTSTARLGRRGADTTIDIPTIITLEEVYA